MNQLTLETIPEASAPPMRLTATEVLLRAIDSGVDLDRLDKLMALQERWEKNEARKAYVRAFAEFKRNMPEVVTDMINKQYGSDYSSLANLVNTVSRHMAPYGLNARWSLHQDEAIEVTCIVEHIEGHRETTVLRSGPDTSGQKNPLQQIKSAITYLEGATFQAITGVVSKAASHDDDGNDAGAPREETPPPKKASSTAPKAKAETAGPINDAQLTHLKRMIDSAGCGERPVLIKYNLDRLEALPFSKLNAALEYIKGLNREPPP